MATDLSDIVKQGYIRVRSKSINIWQKRWIILRRASSKGPVRVDKYFDEKCARNGANHKTSLLTNVATISRLPVTCRKYAFSINFHDGSNKSFSCDSDLEADTWVKLAIQECLLPPPGLATGEPDVLRPGIQKELQEQFNVYLMPTPKLDVFGECLLQVTHENIYLWDISNSKLKLVAWPLTALRRYGSDLTKFTFEAGRHCATGEGMFVFHTLEGEKIYRKVHQATLAIAEAHHKMKKHTNPNHFLDLPQIEARITRQINSSSITCPRDMSSYALTANNATNEEYENDSDKNEETGSSGQFMSEFNHQTSMSHTSHCRISQSFNSPCVLLNTRCSLRASLLK